MLSSSISAAVILASALAFVKYKLVEPSAISSVLSFVKILESTYALIDCWVANFVALFEDMSSSSLIPVTVAPSPAMLIEVAATLSIGMTLVLAFMGGIPPRQEDQI